MSWKDTYKIWNEQTELDADVRADLDRLVTDQTQLEDAFYAPLEFGTAGIY